MTDLSQLSMLDLFRMEVQNQTQVLTKGLLALERDPGATACLEACMRAAHSLKGAARIVGLDSGVSIAHAMEELFVAAQKQRQPLGRARVDGLLQGVDLLERMAHLSESELALWADPQHAQAVDYQRALQALPAADDEQAATRRGVASVAERQETGERVLRLAAENVERLLGLASESLVESRRLEPL